MGLEMWRKAQCSCGQSDKIVQLMLGDETVGLVGLSQIFEQLYALGRAPEDSVTDELVKMVEAKNYVPPKAEAEYATVLMREYRKFCAQKSARHG